MAEPNHIPRNAVVVRVLSRNSSPSRRRSPPAICVFSWSWDRPGPEKAGPCAAAVADRAAWVDGNATAFGVYCAAFMHQDQPDRS